MCARLCRAPFLSMPCLYYLRPYPISPSFLQGTASVWTRARPWPNSLVFAWLPWSFFCSPGAALRPKPESGELLAFGPPWECIKWEQWEQQLCNEIHSHINQDKRAIFAQHANCRKIYKSEGPSKWVLRGCAFLLGPCCCSWLPWNLSWSRSFVLRLAAVLAPLAAAPHVHCCWPILCCCYCQHLPLVGQFLEQPAAGPLVAANCYCVKS